MSSEDRDLRLRYDGDRSLLVTHLVACQAALRGRENSEPAWFVEGAQQLTQTAPGAQAATIAKESYAYSFLWGT